MIDIKVIQCSFVAWCKRSYFIEGANIVRLAYFAGYYAGYEDHSKKRERLIMTAGTLGKTFKGEENG